MAVQVTGMRVNMIETSSSTDLPVFDRNFWDGKFRFTRIGSGALGGKASGLVFIKDLLTAAIDPGIHSGVEVNVPTMAVLATECFDAFVKRNRLAELSFDEMSDDRIGNTFEQADLPVELLGDLRALCQQVSVLCDTIFKLAGRCAGSSFRRGVCDQDDPESPARCRHPLSQAGRGGQVHLRLDVFPRGARLRPDDGPRSLGREDGRHHPRGGWATPW